MSAGVRVVRRLGVRLMTFYYDAHCSSAIGWDFRDGKWLRRDYLGREGHATSTAKSFLTKARLPQRKRASNIARREKAFRNAEPFRRVRPFISGEADVVDKSRSATDGPNVMTPFFLAERQLRLFLFASVCLSVCAKKLENYWWEIVATWCKYPFVVNLSSD